jgi:hypothetical protein
MKIMKVSLLSFTIAAGLALAAVSANASGCCASQAVRAPSESASVAAEPAIANAAVAQPAERGFFSRLFSRFGSSNTCEVTAKSDCCSSSQNAYQAVLISKKDKEDSKSGGCCPAQAASFQRALAKADCGEKADCATKACPAVAKSCDKDEDKKCCPAATSASGPVASAK